LDFARVHCEQHARGPIEEASVYGRAHSFDDFAGQTTAFGRGLVFFGGHVDDYVFEEDSDALDGLGAAGALGGGELEGVGDC